MNKFVYSSNKLLYSLYPFLSSFLSELLGSFLLYFSLTFVAKWAILPLSVALVKFGGVFELEGWESRIGFGSSGIGVIGRVCDCDCGRGNIALFS